MSENRDTGRNVVRAGLDREGWLSADRTTYTHRAGAWESTYPVDRLPQWLAFYGRMHSKTHRPTYAEDLKLLRALEAELARLQAAPTLPEPAAAAVPEGLDPLDAAIAEARAAGLDL